MHATNELRRLAAAAPALLSQAESLVDGVEEDRILERILAVPRPAERRRMGRTARAALAAVGAAVVAAVTVVALGHSPAATRTGGHRLALSGARIDLAGYRFRTPAGFKASSTACEHASLETPVRNGFAAAASADGGCVEAAVLVAPSSLVGGAIPAAAQPVDVDRHQSYYAAGAPEADEATLYVELPNATGDHRLAYLVLIARGLTEDQLVAVAESGLPALPLRPTTTTRS